MTARPTTPLRRALSHASGWLADRHVPGPLRRPVYGAYCALTGADASEAQLEPRGYTSLGAFFVRRLRPGARPIEPDETLLPSPCDGRVQASGPLDAGRILQAKGVDYALADLLAGAERGVDLEGAQTWTLYLSPRDYHRVHAPLAGRLVDVVWAGAARYSVHPKVAGRLAGLFATNERAVLRIETPRGPYLLVMVGALNVGRIRVVGVEPGRAPEGPIALARGGELARFEMGSTVILVIPRALGYRPAPLAPGDHVRLGRPIGARG
jgi:phosphatidylserine decarboxylase